MKHLYLLLTFVGACIPYGAFLPWLLENGLNLPLLFQQAMSTPVSQFAWLDVAIAGVALLVFISVDGQRHRVPKRWLAIVATLTVGVSFGLPLYLYLRECHYWKIKKSAS
ncbi:DUF2834 domain-containing protein [Vibrio sp. NTOU-M3]|uniref:DUF2834 domain-containing protein n=1 Tax=Vibrio sp. NTOU-M3 TaxID=3234954 RepID=UPI00349F206D